MRWFRRGVFLLVVASAHLSVFWSLGRHAPGRPEVPQRVRWIEARRIVEPAPAAAVRAAPVVARRPPVPRPPFATAGVSSAAGSGPDAIQAAPPAAVPPLDLSPETLGRVARQARANETPRRPLPSWRAVPHNAFAPIRQTETVGASGSRVTRVEGPLGTYCVRSPQPGRAPPPTAAPELALPTHCP